MAIEISPNSDHAAADGDRVPESITVIPVFSQKFSDLGTRASIEEICGTRENPIIGFESSPNCNDPVVDTNASSKLITETNILRHKFKELCPIG